MKYLKIIGLAAAAAMALMAFAAGTASATTLENGTSPYSHVTTLHASLVGTASLESTSGTTLDTCSEGQVKGTASTGSATTTVTGSVSTANLTWENCTATTDTLAGGTLEVHHIAGTNNGTVTGSGFEVTVNVFGSCIYGLGAGSVDLGVLEGNAHTAKLDIEAVVTEQGADKFLCPNDTVWDATYHVTTPTGLTVTAG